MYCVTQRLRPFSAAHRLLKEYKGKCNNLHGHNYAVNVTLCAHSLDSSDFVMNFEDIKHLFDNWLQQNWDHATLTSELDPALIKFLQDENQKHFILPDNCNTSAERLAEYLYKTFTDHLNKHYDKNENKATLTKVSVSESPISTAECTKI